MDPSEDASDGNENVVEEVRIGAWMELMGTDLQMKVVEEDKSISNSQSCDVGDALFIEFEARQAEDRDQEDGPVFQVGKDWLVVIGDKDVTPALEMGLRFMREGETSLVYSDAKYAYGPLGRKQSAYDLPPNSNVCYRVKINKLVSDGKTYSSASFQMEIAKSKKVIGNDIYQFEWSNGFGKGKALQLYSKAADAMTNVFAESNDEDVQKEASAILIDCLNNVAAVYLKAKEYGKAKDAATKVLLRDPDNMKALLRAARAAIYDHAGTFEESDAAIAAAEEVDPEDSDLRKLKVELERNKREYKKKSKEMFSKMSSAMKVETGANHSEKSDLSAKVAEARNNESIAPGESHGSENRPEISTGEELLAKPTPWWKIYAPHLIQMVLPFVAYYFFTLMKKDSHDRLKMEADDAILEREF